MGPGFLHGPELCPETGAKALKKVEAIVLEELPALLFRVELGDKSTVLAHGAGASGGRNWVRLLPGDRVEVEFAEHDLTRGRIVKKL